MRNTSSRLSSNSEATVSLVLLHAYFYYMHTFTTCIEVYERVSNRGEALLPFAKGLNQKNIHKECVCACMRMCACMCMYVHICMCVCRCYMYFSTSTQ